MLNIELTAYLVSEHYADDLEVDLQAAMLQDFNVQLEDDSPREVDRSILAFWAAQLPTGASCANMLYSAITVLIATEQFSLCRCP